MVEQIILGIIQGIVEWLPVSSEGVILLVKSNFFPSSFSLADSVRQALFLHFGTFLAALVYFWEDVARLTARLFNYNQAPDKDKKLIKFLVLTTIISGVMIGLFLPLIERVNIPVDSLQLWINLFIGLLLLITAGLQLARKYVTGNRGEEELKNNDSYILGLAQGLAAFPGLSRSGLTVSALLLRGFKDKTALRLSFLMSLPIVLGGNLILQLTNFSFQPIMLVGLVFSFIFGLLTIHMLLRLAEKINFGYFVLFFAVLVIIAAFI